MTRKLGKAFLLALGMVAGSTGLWSSSSAAQEVDPAAFPSAALLAANLDLACHKIEGGETPVRSVRVDQLNPVLREMGFPGGQAQLAELQQLCVPVAKNGVEPPPRERRYIENVDLACYRAYELEARRPISLKLSQLNPVVRRLGLPDHKVLVHGLEQVCVPVAKNNQIPPLDVLWLVQHVDVACYRIESLEALPSIPLRLRHLNPILLALGLPDTAIRTRPPEQLCVPVSKNGLTPPAQVLSVVQWVDFEKFAVDSAAVTRPVTLALNHLNPLFAQFRPFKIMMGALTHLDLPVAKNGAFPPSIGPTP
jgi:hypothetical protein